MGTVVSVTIRDFVDPAAVDEAFAEMRRIEDVFSTFLPDSEISRIGRGELDLRRAPTEVRDVLEVCDDLVARTGGRFQHRPDRPGAPSVLVGGCLRWR